MNLRKFIILVLVFFTSSAFVHSQGTSTMIDYSQGKEIAKDYLTKVGIKLDNQQILDDPENEIWRQNFINNENFQKYNSNITSQLKGRNYWAIQFYPDNQEAIKGGGVIVIVEKETGEIILHFFQK